MEAVKDRQDFSRFLVHLTKDSDDATAKDNLISIIESQVIEAKNHHCLFGYDMDRMEFTHGLKSKFNTVCFTEVPLNELRHLAKPIKGRKIKLSPYGVVFWRDLMIDKGASQAIYINDKGTQLKSLLLEQFRSSFKQVKSIRDLKLKNPSYEDLIRYYSLINIISENYDFAWEREWRHSGNFRFKRRRVAAIIAENPREFERYCKTVLSRSAQKFVNFTPILDPYWGYEEVIEEMSEKLWRVRA
ncbi:abortive infection system antitoxin AbiGi family protein [Vibrio diabolicus]|uniref:abortive infection system antitoxin AbiGi family protein n=1 Tax=Vibrio diabolicus TaxID=50719 RepID=UPI00062E5BC9|nr:abortive infection system antitoxin AbiGi family protein [Vibrio diabolicus]KLE22430.1 hypothetical protein AAW52_21750 [Vibrio diabolicus]MCS0313967.1 abortive infection system antitoxin AbiGi family protein [Vibrio diabolicus]